MDERLVQHYQFLHDQLTKVATVKDGSLSLKGVWQGEAQQAIEKRVGGTSGDGKASVENPSGGDAVEFLRWNKMRKSRFQKHAF